MVLIAGAGDAKSYALEAIANAKAFDFIEARVCLDKARDAMVTAHDIQTDLIRAELVGGGEGAELIMVHAQDHMMGAVLMRELAEEFICLYEAINGIAGKP
jgi:PTS system cellobiose-specific IIA component